ncbi:hypothetical protein BV20DRAFT_1125507 [Pilatotrama ljubarskyi]|nr:hypothetical protein BV20DRAFT_1125507 [Pilatotrama ljubarskyi]
MSSPAISLHLPRTLYVAGCAVEGEVELNARQLHEDNIHEVHVKLRGVAKTEITCDKVTDREAIHLVRDDVSLWARGTAYPPPGSDTLRIPFRLQLPPQLPPSFQYRGPAENASVMYSVTAVGVRPGAFSFNRRIRQPLAIVQKDDGPGIRAREELAAIAATGAEPSWRTEWKEEKMRRGLWGDYSTAEVRCSIPMTSPLPSFVPIPFIIKIQTTTTPLTRAKADTHPPDKPIFPPVPASYDMLDFKLRRKLYLRAGSLKEKPSSDVYTFTPVRGVTVEADIAEKEWRLLEGGSEKEKSPDAKGVWIQRATFRGTFGLDCPPTFAVDIIKCEYHLALKVPFPGLGNDVKLTMPIMVASGINKPIVRDEPGSSTLATAPSFLDLPPAYWDASDRQWDDHKD